MLKNNTLPSLGLYLLLYSLTSSADTAFDNCMQKEMQAAKDSVTLGQLRALCKQVNHVSTSKSIETSKEITEETSAIERRIAFEERQSDNPFSLLPHKPNYLILSHNFASPNEKPFKDAFPNNRSIDLQHLETKFQISFKLPVIRHLWNGKADLFVAYTNRSFWQQFNKKGSSPFRDSNHEPEAWLSFKTDYHVLGFQTSVIRTGIVHQSNGQSGNLSRSWNRAYADIIFNRNDWYFSFKPWLRIPDPANNDDNPDIDDYLGNFELSTLYKNGNQTFDIMLRNNLQSNNKGAFQLGWSFPISKKARGYVQWFNGYGESLIDYDSHSNSLGFGIQLSDWL